ncbi:MAG: nitroreductase family protein [Deltaproteobacteria bacterium]|nr:nitroreductase family protein [Deltaproteobacteria bacterium]
MIEELVRSNRSYRRFHQDHRISEETLKWFIGLARLTPSSANRQPIRYILSRDPEKNARIFPHLAWAGYLTDWSGPSEGERPSAYIVLLGDSRITSSFACDYGIIAQTILLGAVEKELGGCMISSIKRDSLRAALKIPEHYGILLAIAIGKPREEISIDPLGEDGSIRYWRDEKGVHHVPKRSLDELILDI